MNLVLLGAPGSGKGTQAEKLSQKLNLFYLQTGELSREWAKTDKRIRNIINGGKLIPEKEMTNYVMKYLEKRVPKGTNILFEGFPRFISQYEEYEKWLASKRQKIDAVVSLDISEKEAVKRLSGRRICEKCGEVYNVITNPPKESGKCDKCKGKLIQRDDDRPEAIKVRFRYYRNNTKKLIDYLDNKEKLIRVDAVRPINVIYLEILEKLGVKNG
ncbi:hypothetical protein A2715_03045 [Candidatus Woesebacteria bacterium RIFCSPHIGHO2_01_FULL_39_32]|uniref:Adenylate kinase n=2 Tax=Candidatus Woeseibacteriota TaxID=1752722 RepID=A0A0G0PQW5_9BACT|nr:MAG: Adenylate kinase [Candidatus Woesebacteria bacterium GW2011_GWA1_39_8]OGM05449.1 MAG: hypothetical protein A2124_04335 [Candidatus Woesebacteria bacterium GWB1_37_5]OGM24719.1 MAG: hypothetical protein A2715_03045 [Candidatus Woesebacteria bacterium RIFCSPHIGHO2_01_FULL_39_32]OGM38175.1 MAG: hypothetical protein A3F01_00815 [Candidatus Woesebacteria bacterium RIFCSPHIGHO2_12_FULL_38_11]OGM64545.1 MAG: hypothetical protein A2893_05960 [Candidatus Woesebacteria bacterium RIFCSPLOWO2_01_FU